MKISSSYKIYSKPASPPRFQNTFHSTKEHLLPRIVLAFPIFSTIGLQLSEPLFKINHNIKKHSSIIIFSHFCPLFINKSLKTLISSYKNSIKAQSSNNKKNQQREQTWINTNCLSKT